jgi:hypothetical protein
VEYRVKVSYTGASLGPASLGTIRYQPTFSTVDNGRPSFDDNLPFTNAGNQGDEIAGSMIYDQAVDGSARLSYGRVSFGRTAMQASQQNTLTQFRHSGTSDGAPVGKHIRLAGSSVTTWVPANLTSATASQAALNNISRGVIANQFPRLNSATGIENTRFVGGTQNLVVFRGAFQLSDLVNPRTIVISSAPGSQDRVGGLGDADDTRFMNWFTNDFGGSFRSGVVVSDAVITVVPMPGVLAAFGLGGIFAARRRRV